MNIQSSNGTVFEDIEIDGLRFDFPNAWDRLAKVQTFIAKSQWRQDKISGQLRGVVFRNVEIPADAPEGALRVATVGNYSTSSGSTLIFPGSSSATQKRYKRLYSASISNGSKVLVAKVSGTYVILDRIV